ncbi:MAG: hypothetical protein KJ018_15060 [Burkholderiales bacterium]|nr:hypothetical protein [Burkholderiales bacterium]GIK86840.1 MAG: hypothetical protein BroJett026_23210 [Betaproteobacteria bacterium]
MNPTFRLDVLPRALAGAAAVALTAGVLAAVQVEAASGRPPPAIAAEFTGEVTANGPVYRLPTIVVRDRAELFLALPEVIERVLDAHAAGTAQGSTPEA